MIVTHGWPGSIIEQLKIIEPLTNPTADGASAQDAFHLVIPSLPGYGFSAKPTSSGWDPVFPRNLIHYHQLDRGGHFAAWEQPELFAAEMRAAFRSLR